MADSVRMMDLASLTRGLEQFRRQDPEHKVLAQRLATEAAVHRMEQVHREVTDTQRAAEARVRSRDRRSGREREPSHGESQRDPEHPEAERGTAPPETEEGHVIDIKI